SAMSGLSQPTKRMLRLKRSRSDSRRPWVRAAPKTRDFDDWKGNSKGPLGARWSHPQSVAASHSGAGETRALPVRSEIQGGERPNLEAASPSLHTTIGACRVGEAASRRSLKLRTVCHRHYRNT